MSEQKLISPLLDGFLMGDPMSDHDGVCCCPAMKEKSDDKYIVKIISVPASQAKLDALLLTGACKDAGAAMEYFKELAEDIVKEAKLLQQLSKLEGFLPYEGWQIVPMTGNDLGYEVYLLGSYKRSLDKYLRRNTMTHLGAVNLGLDLCSALSVCRRAGFMHVDLRPGNIYLSGDREYRIGDLGFVKLNSLKYTSLPSRYISRYTPPELRSDMATLNPTADIYAVGLILYQIYNNGQLPETSAEEALPAPANADYELAEIILKACHPNPRHRWQTPIEMGQALAGYMQRNSVNDDPIVPPVAEPVAEDAPAAEESLREELPVEAEAVPEKLGFLENMVSDETAPGEDEEDLYHEAEMTDEVTHILTQADDLLAEEEPVEELSGESAEEPGEESDDGEEDDTGFFASLLGELDDDEDEDEPEVPQIPAQPRQKRRGWILPVVIFLILALLGGGAWYYYTNYYLLPIDKMDISTFEDTITVNLTTDVDESLLTVVCTDTYGNTASLPVTNGQVVFTGLNSGSQYNITVVASGFHQTSESTFGTCATAKQTEILDYTAKTGNEDGSVILNFTVNGPETEEWVVEYTTEGEETQSMTFTGHMVTITGLTVDKTYTFKLIPGSQSEMWVVGTDSLEFTASRIVVAENLEITACIGNVLAAEWEVPAWATVESWIVRCYSETGYDQTITVTEPSALFTEIVDTDAYTVEVTAAGMTQSARCFVSANPTTVTGFQFSGTNNITVSWDYTGNAPAGGWLLMYSLNGGKTSEVIKCDEATGVIPQRIPGATYQLIVQAADGATVFDGEGSYTCPQAPKFDQFSLRSDEIVASLCATPEQENWTHKDVKDYPTTYAAGAKVSMVLYTSARFYTYNEDVKVSFIIRDSEGNALTELMTSQTHNWRKMWNNRYAYLDIPALPGEAGEYTIDLYFNDMFVLTKTIRITN